MIQNGIKSSRSLIDPFYKPEYKGSYFLSAQLGKDGLYLAVMDLTNNNYLALEEHTFEGVQNMFQLKTEFENSIENSALIKADFEKSVIGIINEHVSLVPEALFDEQHKSDYLELAHGKLSDFTIYEDGLINTRARNVYAVPNLISSSISEKIPSAQIRHYSSSLIDGLSLEYKRREGEIVVLHVQYSHFEILFFRDGVLQFYNSFNYTTAEDFIYYTLFVFEQLELNADKITVDVFGEIVEDSSVYQLLYKYVRNISFGNRPKTLRYSSSFDVISKHQYYNLFQQFLCV